MGDDQTPPSKHPEFGNINGGVYGYIGQEYTRPVRPARALLLIHIKGKEGSEIYYLAPEKELGKLKKEKVKGIEELQKRHPDVYEQVVGSLERFTPVDIKEENALGRFEFKHIPLGWWCYIAAAYVEDRLYLHTQEMGNNGFDSKDVIHGEEVMHKSDHTIDSVIVPVEDKWMEKMKQAPTIKVNETDKDMDDPDHLKEMVMKGNDEW